MTRITLCLFVLGLVAFGAAPVETPPKPHEKVTIGAETFRLDLAATESTRTRGLSGRVAIPTDGGMLFAFPDARVRHFWMKDCLTDMDIVYLDPRGQIVAMHRMKKEPPRGTEESILAYEARLPLYSSRRPAQFALEFKPGTLDRLQLKIGQRILIDTKRLSRIAMGLEAWSPPVVAP